MFLTLTVRRDCQSVATVALRAANGRVLNEPASHCIFTVSQPTFNYVPSTLLSTLMLLRW